VEAAALEEEVVEGEGWFWGWGLGVGCWVGCWGEVGIHDRRFGTWSPKGLGRLHGRWAEEDGVDAEGLQAGKLGEGGELGGVDAVEDGVTPPGLGCDARAGPAGAGEDLSGGESSEDDRGDAGEKQVLRDAQDDNFYGATKRRWAARVLRGERFRHRHGRSGAGGLADGEFDATGV